MAGETQRPADLIELEYLGLTAEEAESAVDPFTLRTPEDVAEPHRHLLRLMRDPDYFYFTVKYLCEIELAPFQCVILKEMWTHPFPMLIGSRGMGKSFILGLYAVLRALFIQGRKIVITGSGFRQAKTVFNYAENIWHNSPTLRSLVAENARSGPHHDADRWVLRLGESTITALPVGDGTKVRGERAHDLIADEFASIPWEIFETVFSGFSVVSLNPVERARDKARIRVHKRMGEWTEERQEEQKKFDVPNQTLISGTAFYQFNHFCKYWRRWKGIVESMGDPKRLLVALEGEVDEGLDWRDYAIIRFPYTLLPEGYYDEKQVARSRGTIHSGVFMNEFQAVFSSDSRGFYRRSLIESCVTTDPVDGVQFRASTRGNPAAAHVFGIDPASEQDNFSIVVLEVHDTHRRVVHCWTTTRQAFKAKLEAHATKEQDFYGYCARKIRQLAKAYPLGPDGVIAIDGQGGGVAVIEALHDPDKMEPGERPIWPVTPDHPLSDGKERDTDSQAGLHVLEVVQFARSEWVAESNHGMRKDLEDRALLFPMFDTVLLAAAFEEAEDRRRRGLLVFDTLEDCVEEIEELKDELTTIEHSQTPGTLRDRWDTPEVKLAGSKKGRLRKDRYSALLMANSAARRLQRQLAAPEVGAYGGFATEASRDEGDGRDWDFAPDWFQKSTPGDGQGYGWVV